MVGWGASVSARVALEARNSETALAHRASAVVSSVRGFACSVTATRSWSQLANKGCDPRIGYSVKWRVSCPNFSDQVAREGSRPSSSREKFGELALASFNGQLSRVLQIALNRRSQGDFAQRAGESVQSRTAWRMRQSRVNRSLDGNSLLSREDTGNFIDLDGRQGIDGSKPL